MMLKKGMLNDGDTAYINHFETPPLAPLQPDESSTTITEAGVEVPKASHAFRKFQKLDKDGDGTLDTEEALELAQWAYTSFRQDGAKLSPQQAAIEAEKLVNKLDKDGDALLSFDEFAEFFEKKVKLAKKFADKNKGAADALAAVEEGEKPSDDVEEGLPTVSEAYRKFQELDADKSGMLTSGELLELAKWVYQSFQADGNTLPEEQVEREAGRLLKKLDTDNDGGITFDEFVGYYETKLKQAQVFKQAVEKKKNALLENHLQEKIEMDRMLAMGK